MGLIKAAIYAGSSTLADQWLEYIYCDRMDDNVLMRKGTFKSEGSNTKGTDNTITNGFDFSKTISSQTGIIQTICPTDSLFCF